MWVLIAIAVMMSATIAVHLGLPQAMCSVAARVCKCHKCLSFWATFGVLWWFRCDMVAAVLSALAMAYLSNWFGVLLIWLNHKYTELWQRVNRKKKAHR